MSVLSSTVCKSMSLCISHILQKSCIRLLGMSCIRLLGMSDLKWMPEAESANLYSAVARDNVCACCSECDNAFLSLSSQTEVMNSIPYRNTNYPMDRIFN